MSDPTPDKSTEREVPKRPLAPPPDPPLGNPIEPLVDGPEPDPDAPRADDPPEPPPKKSGDRS